LATAWTGKYGQTCGKPTSSNTIMQTILESVRNLSLRSICVLLCLCALPGCKQNPETAPVVGMVTLDGRPLTGGSVTFTPISGGQSTGRSAYGEIRSDGTFTLGTYAKADGAVIGTHLATIYGHREPKHDRPPSHARGEEVTLVAAKPMFGLLRLRDEFTVAADSENSFTIELTTQLIEQFGEDDD
jgi:hypothetical protein